MQKRILGIVLSSALMAPLCAVADGVTKPGFYVGGGYSDVTLDDNDLGKDADVGVLFARGGYQINQNIAVEARLGTGVQDDRVYGAKVEIEDTYGAYVKAGLPTTVGLYPYALLGVTHSKVKVSGSGVHDSSSDSDLSYGLGVDYWFNNQVSAGLEWAKWYDKDGLDIDGISLGLNLKF